MYERRLGNWIQEYLCYTDNSEAPKLFREWCAVSTIAAALRRKVWLEWGEPVFYPNMYIVLVGPPAARKGTAMRPCEKFLTRLEIPVAAEAVTREALIRTLKESETMHVDKTTGRSIIHSSLTVHSPELTVFLGYNNIQLMSDLTDWFDCRDRWMYRTKNSGTDDISGVFVNILGATTPSLIRTTLPLDAIGGGLTSRIIFVYEKDKEKIVALPFLSEEDKRLGEDLYYDLECISHLVGRCKVTTEFLQAYSNWYTTQHTKKIFRDAEAKAFAGYIERRATHLLKLSIIMRVARASEQPKQLNIDVEDFEAAKNLLERTEVKMPYVFGGVGSSHLSNVTYNIVQDLLVEGPKSRKEIAAKYIYEVSAEELSVIIRGLEATGDFKTVRDPSTKELWIHPPDSSKFDLSKKVRKEDSHE